MTGYVDNIEKLTLNNTNYRQVLYTTSLSQLVLMLLQPGQDIGEETHAEHDQFLRIESGQGTVVLNGESFPIADGTGIIIPAGVKHNVINSAQSVMRLYTIYTPPEHPEGTVQVSKPQA